MRRQTYWTAWLAGISILTNTADCAPELAFPINAQLPPVAYASVPYSFTFAETTFQTDSGSLSYAINDGPQWLSVDSASRTLRGTPSASDEGAFNFVLSATDATGTTTNSVTLIVTGSRSIQTGEPILSSLQAVGQVQGPSTLFLRPQTPFSIPLSQTIFSGTSFSTTYYAVSGNNSPLPPWIQFDSQTLRLFGTTPPILSSNTQQQGYGVKVVASNIIGFSEAGVPFTIAVANRLFYFQSATTVLNVTAGQLFQSEPYRNVLLLDGAPIAADQLKSAQAVLPSWLSLDSQTITLSGTPPDDFTGQMVTITAQDQSNDVANLTVTLTAASSTSSPTSTTTSQPLSLKAQAGEYLDFKFDPSVVAMGDAVSVNFGSASNWLSFSDNNMSLYGQVPEDLGASVESLTLNVTSSGITTVHPINLVIAAADRTSSTESATSTSETATATNTADQDNNGKPRHVLAIVLTTVLVTLAVLAIILFCLWHRRRKEKKRQQEKIEENEGHSSRHSSSMSVISEVSIPEEVVNIPTIPDSSRRTSAREMVQTPTQVPQVELPWAPDSLKKARSRLQKKKPAKGHESFDSNWGGLVPTPSAPSVSPVLTENNDPDAFLYPGAAPPIPTYSPKRKQSHASSKVTKRSNSKRSVDNRMSGALSNVTNRRSGLPNRLSNAGVGHGSGILTPSLHSGNPYRNSKPPPTRSSWATTFASTIAGKENKHPSVATANLEQFPIPPSTSYQRSSGSYAGLTDTKPSLAGLATAPTKPSLRVVSASPNNSTGQIDTEEFSSRREEYYRTRRRLEGQSMLFSNSSSRTRTPSLSRFVPGTQAIRTPSTTFPIAEESSSPEITSTDPPGPTANWRKLSVINSTPPPLARPTNSHILSPTPQRPPTRFGPSNGTPVPFGGYSSGVRVVRPISISSGQFSSALSSSGDSQWEDEVPDVMSPYHGGLSPGALGAPIRPISAAESATDEMLRDLSAQQRARQSYNTNTSNNPEIKDWQTTSSSSASVHAGPSNRSTRLPFNGGRPSGETEDREIGLAIQKALRRASQLGSGRSRGLRLVDKRKRIISVDGKDHDDASDADNRRGRRDAAGVNAAPLSPSAAMGNATKHAWGGREKSQKGSLRFI